ncbi:hypothetical protein [Cellulomonas iranensis]|nr:hypothetical protein [Cellulomonas iranensis]
MSEQHPEPVDGTPDVLERLTDPEPEPTDGDDSRPDDAGDAVVP